MVEKDERATLRIIVGADDAGVDYKEALAEQLRADPRVSEVIDVGVRRDEYTAYPDVAGEAARRVAAGEADRALLICGTGLGMAIAANKTPGIRAVTAHDPYSVARSVLSNNAQILAMGQRVIGLELARTLVDSWLGLRFDDQSPSAAKVQLITLQEQRLGSSPASTDVPPADAQTSASPAADAARAAADGAASNGPAVRRAVVGSRVGLHARPAMLFAQAVKRSGHTVRISRGDTPPVIARSVLAVMTIGAAKGDEVQIRVEGPNAEAVADELAALVAADLDEA